MEAVRMKGLCSLLGTNVPPCGQNSDPQTRCSPVPCLAACEYQKLQLQVSTSRSVAIAFGIALAVAFDFTLAMQ